MKALLMRRVMRQARKYEEKQKNDTSNDASEREKAEVDSSNTFLHPLEHKDPILGSCESQHARRDQHPSEPSQTPSEPPFLAHPRHEPGGLFGPICLEMAGFMPLSLFCPDVRHHRGLPSVLLSQDL